MQSQHESLLIISASLAVLFGTVAGGVTGYLSAGQPIGTILGPTVEHEIEGLSFAEEQALAQMIADEQATISVVESVMPSVVSIIIEKEFSVGFFSDPFVTDGEVRELFEVGGGTGFFVSEDGLVVTNKHVVSDAEATYTVVTSDGQEFPAEVLSKDVFLDFALLRVEGEGFQPVKLGDSDAIKIGQTAIAIGNSLSEFPNSVTKGIISGVDRTIVAGDEFGEQEVIDGAIQTDAAISEGNSGGPLINLFGEVIGVNTAVSLQGQSLGFAIPINVTKDLIADVKEFGRIVRPWLGVRYIMIDEDVKEEFELDVDNGALVLPGDFGEASVVAGSPAEDVGLQDDDVILSVDDMVLSVEMTLGDAIHEYEPGDIVTLSVLRNGEQIQLEVTLAELDPEAF